MIKRLLAVCVIVFFTLQVNSQTYGNEWINYSQNYYKIKIAQNGVYRIDSATLAAAGIPCGTGGINPRNIQLFNRGIQQNIFIQGESDNEINSSDFIEFYGEKNDGTLDTLLYVNTPFIPNPYYSLINDTAVYFLTWNSSTTNARMQVDADFAFSSYTPDLYFFKDEVLEMHNGYYEGLTDNVGGTDARYTAAEGWFDNNVIDLGVSAPYNLNTTNVYTSGPNATIKTVVVGASKIPFSVAMDHTLRMTYNGFTLINDTVFRGYQANQFIYGVPAGNLSSPFTNFIITSVASAGYTSNRTTLSYIDVKYPHLLDLEGKTNFLMYIPNTTQPKSFLPLTNFSASGTVHVYDLTNAKRIDVVTSGTNDSVLITNNSTAGEKNVSLLQMELLQILLH